MTTPTRLRAADVPAWRSAHPDALVLDSRDAAAYAQGHWPGSLRLDGRNHEALLLREPKTRPVLITCYHGNASRTYAQMFRDFGFQHVVDLIGGWAAWTEQQATAATAPALPDHHGNTPLMTAAWRGDAEAVATLLAAGADVHAVNHDGNTALWLACVSARADVVRTLVTAGAALDHQNLAGATVLMYAASSNKPAIVKLLLELGANPGIQSQDDFTALDMAAGLECLQLLRHAA
ncbi:ankyrin repeat domain-containing protein [Roseateles cellulosilyticus]|uniref:Ankyrin repeat domain-containing protein n=1 Tax=Pelomonas cellulosilytica TaxID=2906762 RepID=A0ABS8Y1H8_9BURK|nr:ankyrin repeat domain-containing protein [Pelomonas sp. P8]MCE4556798.1 ankyrin repeat domain-containing protein [Pelomonas sp. P8]